MEIDRQASVVFWHARQSLAVIARPLIIAACLWGGVGCGRSPVHLPSPAVSAAPEVSLPPKASGSVTGDGPWFVDATERAGPRFQHDSGVTGELLLPEISGSGAALFDFDCGGDLDAFLVQGGSLNDQTPESESETRRKRPGHRLFRNDLDVRAGHGLMFTDITKSSGILSAGYGMGVATGDFNNDGRVDLYVTNLGSNQ